MRFGLFYEHQLPRPWADGADEKLLREALDQIELADRLGFDYVWEVEHHFLEEYSHSSAPEVFLAAASQRTRQIRLGHGIVQLPPAINPPARVAERIATLDLLSGGRVDFGGGEGSSQAELGGFGVAREHKRAQFEEALECITRMFVEEPFAGMRGRWLDVPVRNVVPKPKQKPHPPLWLACSRRETIEYAARRGLGALSFAFLEPEAAKPWVDAYYDIFERECVPAGYAVNPNLAVVLPLMCHEDEQTAIERGIDGAHFFGYSLAHYCVFGSHAPGRTNVWEQFERSRREHGFARELIRTGKRNLSVKIVEGSGGSMRGAVGTPAQVLELVQRYQAAGVDQIIFVSQAGFNEHEHICESLQLVAEKVLPAVHEGREQREAEKRARLAEACERAMSRRAARPAPGDRPDYVIEPKGEPRPAQPVQPYAHVPAPPRDLKGMITRTAQGALARSLETLSDPAIERLFGSDLSLAAFFRSMPPLFHPAQRRELDASLQLELGVGGEVKPWYLHVHAGRLSVRAGRNGSADAVLRISLPDFLRAGTGVVHPGQLIVDGKLDVEGDLSVANYLMESFGGGGSGGVF